MISLRTTGLPLLSLIFAATTSSAQDPLAVLIETDPILGNGTFERVDDLKVNNNGTWIAEIFTDFSPPADNCVLRDGFVAIREGAVVSNPAGTNLKQFDTIDLNDNDQLIMIVSFNGTGSRIDAHVTHGSLTAVRSRDMGERQTDGATPMGLRGR